MKSIISIALAAVALLSVLTGCGRNNENAATSNTPVATTMPARNTPSAPANGAEAGESTNRVENGTNDAANGAENGANGAMAGVENGVNDMVNGVKDGMDDLLGDDGVINGDMNDGRVEDGDAKTDGAKATATPQAR